MNARATLIVSSAILALGGCKDSGLPDRNLPLDQAEHRAPDALVQAVHPLSRAGSTDAQAGSHDTTMVARPITVGGQVFQASGMPTRMSAGSLRAVGGGAAVGGSFSAATWDEPPYDQLYLAHPGGLHITYLPVHDSGDPAARAQAGRDAVEGGPAAAH